MKLTNNANITTNALAIRKENSLDIVRRFTSTTFRISDKTIGKKNNITLLNLVI